MHLRRAKGGISATHPLLGDELRVLRNLKGEAKSPFVFVSERNTPFTVAGFAKLIERAGIAARLPLKAHPHMLRHATGFALANRGTDTRTLQAYLGHRSIQSTVRYTELAPGKVQEHLALSATAGKRKGPGSQPGLFYCLLMLRLG